MKTYLFCLLLVLPFSSIENSLPAKDKLNIQSTSCDYKINPVGIDEARPRLSWIIASENRGVMQTAYRVRVAKTEKDLIDGKSLVWDTGKVTSDQSTLVQYNGENLIPKTRYFWSIKVWDNLGNETPWSTISYWETGLLDKGWNAQWIRSPDPIDKTISEPCSYFRKEITVGKNLISARMYATALGLYEAEINGEKVGEQLFTPGWTSYDKRVQYQTYDITPMLQVGTNAVSVALGDGWYRGYMGFGGQKNFYGNETAIRIQIQLNYADGNSEEIITDESWKVSEGPIIESDIYNGEIYDARKELTDFSKEGFDDSKMASATVLKVDGIEVVAPEGPPIIQNEILEAVDLFTTPRGETVIDFGQNLVGRIRMKVSGKSGQKVTIHHAEVLDKHGNFYTENLRAARQTVEYTISGKDEEIYEPKFTFQGFRYIRIKGYPGTIKKENFQAVVIHSEIGQAGDFECSEPLINQLQHNIRWGQKGNFLDVPTDCPQRDERMGWTGDAQAFSRTAAFNAHVAGFFIKWLKDLSLDQMPNGAVPFVIPNVLGENANAATGWADAATIIPWNMYLAYGDTRFLENQYESMKKWVSFMTEEAGEDYLWNTGFHFGDWLFYSVNDDRMGASAITDRYFLAQAFFAHSVDLLMRSAKVLNKAEDVKKYNQLYEKVLNAFRKEYITPGGRLSSNTQTAYVLALEFNLIPDHLIEQAVERLVDNISSYRNHITTGFLGTPHICQVLSRYGRLDIAYELLHQESYPSWLYPVKMGATTIWERWDGIKPDTSFQEASMNSFNHYAYGAIGDWMYRVIAGIEIDEQNPGYKNILIAPKPGGKLSKARASHHSSFGLIESGWAIKDGELSVFVQIPANTTANITLPFAKLEEVTVNGNNLIKEKGFSSITQSGDEVKFKTGSGSYFFKYPSHGFSGSPSRFSLNSTIEELMADKEAGKLLESYFPEITNHAYLDRIKTMSIPKAIDSFIVLPSPEKLKEYESKLKSIE